MSQTKLDLPISVCVACCRHRSSHVLEHANINCIFRWGSSPYIHWRYSKKFVSCSWINCLPWLLCNWLPSSCHILGEKWRWPWSQVGSWCLSLKSMDIPIKYKATKLAEWQWDLLHVISGCGGHLLYLNLCQSIVGLTRPFLARFGKTLDWSINT